MTTQYRIEIEGRLPAGVAEELAPANVEWDGRITTLRGSLTDTAALYGLIARLEALGLTVAGIRSGPRTSTEETWSTC